MAATPASTISPGMANQNGLGRSFGTLTDSTLSPGRSFSLCDVRAGDGAERRRDHVHPEVRTE
jgi:hypothetical protein